VPEKESARPPVYYCNWASMQTSVFDFVIRLGKRNRPGEQGEEVPDLEIVMSPQHAKAFLNLLARNVSRYEELFGPISVTPSKTGEGMPN
jgi:hypothetical protein